MKTQITDHLLSMCDTPCDIVIDSLDFIKDNAVFVLFSFDGEPQAAVYYPSENILMTPTDWQSGYPSTPDEIDDYQWISSAGDEALVLLGLPRLFSSLREDTRKEFGNRIQSLREERGLTQGDLAAKSGLLQATISRIENGRYNLTLDTITRLATALNTELI